jgi:hypothetical protein
MTLATLTPPPHAVSVINRLTQRPLTGAQMPRTDAKLKLSHLAQASVLSSLPVYVSQLHDVTASNLLVHARLISWLFFLRHADEPIVSAEIKADDAQANPLIGLRRGPYEANLASALTVAQNDRRLSAIPSEVRLLRIPALSVFAVWLNTENFREDLLVPISPCIPQLQANHVYSASDLAVTLAPMATQKLSRPINDRVSD